MGGKLETCAGCARHVRVDETKCPFCDRPRIAKKGRAVATLAASVAFGMTLAACYGRPPPPGGWGPPPSPTPAPSPSDVPDAAPTAFGPPAPTQIGPPPAPTNAKAKGR